jgi:hypothetical protein
MSTIASTIEPAPTFPLPFARQRDALAKLEAYLTRVSQKIQQSKELRRCYEFSDGLIKLHDDRPQYDTHRLRSFLQGRWNGLREPHDYPIPAPARNGMFSIRSRDWGRLAYCDDQLTLWAEFETLCHLMKSVRNFSSEHVSAHNEVFPRIKSAIDGLSLLADPDLLQSVSEKALLWIRLPDLEARCLATVCRTRYGRAVMAEAAVSHKNLNRFTADELDLAGSGFMTGADRTSINSYIEKLAGCLLFSAGLRLSDHATMGLFRRVGATSISLDLMRSIRDRLVDRFPELDRIECETAASFFRRFSHQPPNTEQRSITHEIHIALDHRSTKADRLNRFEEFAERRCLGYEERHELLAIVNRVHDVEGLAQDLLAEDRHTPTGRLRGHCLLTESTAEFLDLADDVIKSLHFTIGVEMSLPVWKIDEALVAEVPERDAARIRSQVEAVAQATGARLLNMPLSVDIQIATS